ncbi:hypothetical protein HYALB_00008549 [Hymenoscyphus albidus]|uniref:Uncharacterized protein n=1 Tax=Hymenoscyphus albidus TaxID=595503 RepID=A0A9N9LEQ5_9HELO|nr:hypothetical protein HYALB_00008549 [Hymenoscyphus albidus]
MPSPETERDCQLIGSPDASPIGKAQHPVLQLELWCGYPISPAQHALHISSFGKTLLYESVQLVEPWHLPLDNISPEDIILAEKHVSCTRRLQQVEQ